MNKYMPHNEGKIDRAVRLIAGVIITSLLFWGPRTYWAWLGLIPLLTGAFGFCPLYYLIGISTRPFSNK